MDLTTDTLWFEIAIICGMFAFGGIFFGHFEEHTPKIKRVLKMFLFIIIEIALSKYLGRGWAMGFLGALILGVIYIHGIWLPGKGINGLTGEPKRKYYELKGWTKYLDKDASQ